MNAPAPARLILVAALLSPVLARAQDASAPPADDQKAKDNPEDHGVVLIAPSDQKAAPSTAAPASSAATEPAVRGKDKPEERGVVLIAPSDEGDLTNHDATDAAVAVANARDVTSRRIAANAPNVYVLVENNQSYVYGPQDDGGYAARQAVAQANLSAAVGAAFTLASTRRITTGGAFYLAPRSAFYRSSRMYIPRGGTRYYGGGFQRFGGSGGTGTQMRRWPRR